VGTGAETSAAYVLVMEGYRSPIYWMHLEVAAGTTGYLGSLFEGYMARVLWAFEGL